MAQDTSNRSASGSVLSAGEWLDDHFEACREPYEAMVEAVGFEPGSLILDAGCGTGSFATSLRRTVGMSGGIVASDVDVQNLRHVPRYDARAAAVAGSGIALPFQDGAFDGVWTANVTQYLGDEDLTRFLSELTRVVRPGGLVAVKDVDMTAFRFSPASPFLGAHLAEACVTTPPVAPESHGSLRGPELGTWLARAGLVDVSQRTSSIEYPGPLTGAPARLWASWLPYLALLAKEKGVPARDLAEWQQVATAERARAFVERDDFYGRELHVLAVARVPDHG